MQNDIISTVKRVECASSCIEIYSAILKDKLISMGKIKNEADLLVEFKNDYKMIHLILSHIADKSDEITEAVNACCNE